MPDWIEQLPGQAPMSSGKQDADSRLSRRLERLEKFRILAPLFRYRPCFSTGHLEFKLCQEHERDISRGQSRSQPAFPPTRRELFRSKSEGLDAVRPHDLENWVSDEVVIDDSPAGSRPTPEIHQWRGHGGSVLKE
jgi:hypothetical protein